MVYFLVRSCFDWNYRFIKQNLKGSPEIRNQAAKFYFVTNHRGLGDQIDFYNWYLNLQADYLD